MTGATEGTSGWPGGRWLKMRRSMLGMTQEDLAARSGISVKVLSMYENDRVQPRKANRLLLVSALADGEQAQRTASRHGDADGGCSAFCREVKRLLGPHAARPLVVWREEDGELAGIAEADDSSGFLTVRTRVLPTTPDDLRSLRALVDRVESAAGGPDSGASRGTG